MSEWTPDLATVKVSAADTTYDTLINKTVAGSGIGLSILSVAGVEKLQIASTASAGGGANFYLDAAIILASGANNDNITETLVRSPTATGETIDTTTVNNNTLLARAYLYNTALVGSNIDAGTWTFNTWAYVDNAAGTSEILTNIYRVRYVDPLAITVTTSGVGTSRTATASAGAPFATPAEIVASATNDVASYLQTPQGLYQITARADDQTITITTPNGYSNENAVTFFVWKKLFQVTTGEINAVGLGAITLYTTSTVQTATAISAGDRFSAIYFAKTTNVGNIAVSFAHNGTTHVSYIVAPFTVRHNDLEGLDGGAANEYYHLSRDQWLAVTAGTNTRVLFYGASLYPTSDAAFNYTTASGVLAVPNVSLAQGTLTLDKQAISSTATWNAGLVTFTHWKAVVTSTASAAASLLLDMQIAGTGTVFKVAKTGAISFTETGGSTLLTTAGITDLQPLYRSGATITSLALGGQLGGTWASPTVTGITSTDPATLTFGLIPDNYFLVRSGGNVIGTNSVPYGYLSGLTSALVLYGSGGGGIAQDTAFSYNGGTHVLSIGTGTAGLLTLAQSAVSLGATRGAVGAATLNLVSNTGSPAYNLKIDRASGANGLALITNTGTGGIQITSEGATGDIVLQTNSATGATLFSTQNLTVGGVVADVATSALRVQANRGVTAAAGANWNGIDFTTSTLTLNVGAGPITKLAFVNIDQPTISGAYTTTNAATVYIANAPAVAGGGTLTNAWALLVPAGNVKFGGTLYFYETGGATLSVAGITDLQPLYRSGTTVTSLTLGGQLGGTWASPDVRGMRETGGATLLTYGAVADGKFLKRSGATVVGDDPTGASAVAAIANDFMLMGG